MKCGTLNDDAARFCTQCGHAITAAAAPSAEVKSVFAGFWLRVGAHLIDQFILGVAFFFGMMFFGVGLLGIYFGSRDQPDASLPLLLGLLPLFLAIWALLILAPWLYCALFESGSRQATLGKMACGIKVTDLNGNRISFGRATGRFFAEWITGMTMLVGYLMVTFTDKRQTLHDMIAGTVVVGANIEPAQVATAPPVKPMAGLAIAGIVLLAVVPIFGILAAIAIPAVHDYTVRTQVSEGLILANEYKAGVEEYVADNGEWPKDLAAIGGHLALQTDVEQSHYVDSIEIWNGTIVITYGGNAHQQISGLHLSLRPFLSGDGAIAWQCGNGSLPDDFYYDPDTTDGEMAESAVGVTNVRDKYLPFVCRAGRSETTAL